ncbi:hypothetical protein AWM75_08165 [Aerococcus urinaehominis]|uniref:Uncharacterized protein n=1 Tax=Aerococcus urinaehominis TaxID=128944 RepID=A0A0X8FME0_9LACT|nr:hypothetical protein [Aerococcus urinaehominis]AMB99945.1 hypothetical protein AWM75_08165 [Aerococcus urinaehominis]SDM42368.1 PTS system fructose IIA component [Aerococcus urinaehominis]
MRVVICSHGPAAQGMFASVELIAGPQEDVAVITHEEAVIPEELGQEMYQKLQDMGRQSDEPAIIFVDQPYGLPYEAAMTCKAIHPSIMVATGYNMTMLVEFFIKRGQMAPAELVNHLKMVGRDAIDIADFKQEIVH